MTRTALATLPPDDEERRKLWRQIDLILRAALGFRKD